MKKSLSVEVRLNRIHNLSSQLDDSLLSFEEAFNELAGWKDRFLLMQFSPNIKAKFTLSFGKLLRSKTQLTKPLMGVMHELESNAHVNHVGSVEAVAETKQVKIDDSIPNDRAKFQEILHAALRKIENLETQLSKAKAEKLLSNWETIVNKVVTLHKKNPRKFKQMIQETRLKSSSLHEQAVVEELKTAAKLSLMRSHHSEINLHRLLTQRQEIEAILNGDRK